VSLATPIDEYLAEQADLSAVERFARVHEAETLPSAARYYRQLLPAAPPGPGQQYGFEVDLDACTGCKACVTACHSLNGLDDDESWRSVGLLHGGAVEAPTQQTVTTACHHCVDPACLSGCPVDAYEKDPITGIVSHLDDQCIGCAYCTLTCPYEVPRFNPSRGIVRKCDMCRGRLAEGEAPACVQACPNGAIRIAVVDTAAVVATAASSTLVPGAPPSSITAPTTVYRTTRVGADDLRAADHFAVRPGQAHTPLAVMLVLTQLSVGAFVAGLVLPGGSSRFDTVTALAFGLLALGASVLHLGRPLYCFRAVIGLRHSWLSREIVAFGAFATTAGLYAVIPSTVFGASAAVFGVAGVACSVMIYAVTHRTWWRARIIGPKFVLTATVCGAATVGAVELVLVASCAKLLLDAMDLRRGRTALLLLGDLAAWTRWRFVLGVLGGVVLPVVALSTGMTLLVAASLACVVAGELVERSLFFRAVTAPRMPGTLA
jgi:formate dehydrogenase iron-sulfur subunit